MNIRKGGIEWLLDPASGKRQRNELSLPLVCRAAAFIHCAREYRHISLAYPQPGGKFCVPAPTARRMTEGVGHESHKLWESDLPEVDYAGRP